MTDHRRVSWTWALVLALATGAAWGQAVEFEGRIIAQISVEGVAPVSEQLVLNQIRVQAGDPYDSKAVAADITNITRLGRFSKVEASVQVNDDGTLRLVYQVEEQPLLADVQVVGNKSISDQELLGLVMLQSGDPRDQYLIDRGREQMRKAYQEEGFFLANITVDEEQLAESGILIFRVREGPQPKVREIVFEGNDAFTAKQLQSQIRTNTHIFVLRAGHVSDEVLALDESRLTDFYLNRGYLDVRADSRVDPSDDMKDLRVVFLIAEGRQYTVWKMTFQGNTLYSDATLQEAMPLKVGDVYSADKLRKSEEAVRDIYGKVGFLETRVTFQRVYHPTDPKVEVKISVREAPRSIAGNVIIRGNPLTQDKVLRRQIRGIEPGRPIDGTGIKRTERRLMATRLVTEARVTVLGEPGDEVRDVLLEAKEANTGSMSFGAAISSDSGVFGAVDLTQRNFDWRDWPESWSELAKGRAFRGAGQFFSITAQPGNEFQRYQVTFREPYIFDSDYFLDTSAFFFTRDRGEYEEQRVGGTARVGKRFGDVWSAAVRVRYEAIDIFSLDVNAPVDVFAVAGQSTVEGLGFEVSRSTVDDRIFPTRGTRMSAGIERVGVFGGDYDFTRVNAEFRAFWTVDEDFFERKTILSLRTQVGYILEDNEAPIFERFYAGGHRSFRGFDFRGVGPRGIRADTLTLGNDPVGGDFLFLLGTEYNFPIWGQLANGRKQDIIRGVFFIETGTVDKNFSLSRYRVSVGGGLRLVLPIFGQAPFAFDLAYPLIKEEGDEERIFSFDIALPF